MIPHEFLVPVLVLARCSLTHFQQIIRRFYVRLPVMRRPTLISIYLPTNTHEPIAYYQTSGTNDDRCPWTNPQKSTTEGGKYCFLNRLKDNGLTTEPTIPLATSGTHKSTEFTGCKEGYPVNSVLFRVDIRALQQMLAQM